MGSRAPSGRSRSMFEERKSRAAESPALGLKLRGEPSGFGAPSIRTSSVTCVGGGPAGRRTAESFQVICLRRHVRFDIGGGRREEPVRLNLVGCRERTRTDSDVAAPTNGGKACFGERARIAYGTPTSYNTWASGSGRLRLPSSQPAQDGPGRATDVTCRRKKDLEQK